MNDLEKHVIEEATGMDADEVMGESPFVDAGNVLIMVGNPATGKAMPVPLPAVFEQLFGILGDMDQRLIALEGKVKDENRIITV